MSIPKSIIIFISFFILSTYSHDLITPFPKDLSCDKYPCYYNLNGLTQNGAKRFSFYNGIVDSFVLDRGFVQGTQLKLDKPETTSLYRTRPVFAAVVFGSKEKNGLGYMYSIYNQNSGVIEIDSDEYVDARW